MAYEYSDPRREEAPHALPDVEVFWEKQECEPGGFYYAFGFPGCLWDSDPIGPFPTYEAALAEAQEECI